MPLEPRGHEEAKQICLKLAESLPWSQVILNRWPVVLASEYWRLRHELEHGRPLAAMLQFKDLAELLVKVPVIIAARLLVEHGTADQKAQARWLLLSPQPPTLGTWLSAGGDLLEAAVLLDSAQPWLEPLGVAMSPDGISSDLWTEIANRVLPWRNRDLAHGALKLDLADLTGAFESVVSPLLAELARHEDAWRNSQLVARLQDAPNLTGEAALDDQSGWLEKLGECSWIPLSLRHGNGAEVAELDLGPYVCLRKRDGAGGVHVYVLNKRIKRRRHDGIHLLDYQTGHAEPHGRVGGGDLLEADFESLPHDLEQMPAGDLSVHSVREFLDSVSFDNEFISPAYLREWLSGFINEPGRDRGLAWLRGPGDVGKTLFSYSLATRGSVRHVLGRHRPPRLQGIQTIVVPLRKEYRCSPPSLSSEVQLALGRVGDASFLGLEGFLKDQAWAGNKPGAFCAWLDLIRREATVGEGTGGRLLLVLDGLDELPPRNAKLEGGSILDLLPPADLLPRGVFLLVTSRSAGPDTPEPDRCPEFIFEAMRTAWDASAPELRTEYELDPAINPDYRALLFEFFRARVREQYGNDDAAIEAAFVKVLEAAEHRFKWLSHYTALIGNGTANVEALQELKADPLRVHLQALEKHDSPKRFALVRSILLHLAAAEEAHRAEVRFMEPAPVIDTQWLGLDVLELARRVGYPSDHPRALDPRFVSALYSVSELLRSYRGEAAETSRFALGLKGMLEQLEQIEGWETASVLRANLQDAFDDLDAAEGVEARVAALQWAAGPALALASKGVSELMRFEQARGVAGIVADYAQQLVERQMRHADAIRLAGLGVALCMLADEDASQPGELKCVIAVWYSGRGIWRVALGQLSEAIVDFGRAIELMEGLRDQLGGQCPPAFRNYLASAYVNRGNAHEGSNALAEAIADFGRAIELMEDLRGQLGAQWSPKFRNALASAYMNRGVAHEESSALAEAIADHGRAIELMEGLREQLGAQWPPEFRNALANAYANRGVTHGKSNALAEAIADFGRAIDLREGLREQLGAQWPPAFRNDLASAYMNRGSARSVSNALAEAIADYGRAIELMEGLREQLGAQWPPAFRNALASAYTNRGVTHGKSNALAEAIADFGRAIELMEGLREQLGAQWPPKFRNALAGAYMNRGTAHGRSHPLAEAIADFGRAIELMEGLREQLGAQWPPEFRNALASAYMNRGNAHSISSARAEAVADHGRAIELMESLREQLGAQWPPAFRNALAGAYVNRGVAHNNSNALAEAIADYGRATELMEGLCEQLGAQWPPEFRNTLAGAYMNRGVAHEGSCALAEAIADYGRAIKLMEELREQLGEQWPPELRANLVLALRNRALAHSRAGDSSRAEADRRRADALSGADKDYS